MSKHLSPLEEEEGLCAACAFRVKHPHRFARSCCSPVHPVFYLVVPIPHCTDFSPFDDFSQPEDFLSRDR